MPVQHSIKKSSLKSLVILCIAGQCDHAQAATRPSPNTPPSSSPAPSRGAGVGEWLAFGSGCRSSQKSPSQDVTFESTQGKTLLVKFLIRSLRMELNDNPSGLRECALRFTVTPDSNFRVSHVQASTSLHAHKDTDTHLRAHLLLMLGESVIARQRWDLSPQDFARHRTEKFNLSAGATSETPMPTTKCNEPQIIGLDYTLEGLRAQSHQSKEKRSEKAWLATPLGTEMHNAIIEIFFEKCAR